MHGRALRQRANNSPQSQRTVSSVPALQDGALTVRAFDMSQSRARLLFGEQKAAKANVQDGPPAKALQRSASAAPMQAAPGPTPFQSFQAASRPSSASTSNRPNSAASTRSTPRQANLWQRPAPPAGAGLQRPLSAGAMPTSRENKPAAGLAPTPPWDAARLDPAPLRAK